MDEERTIEQVNEDRAATRSAMLAAQRDDPDAVPDLFARLTALEVEMESLIAGGDSVPTDDTTA